MAKVQDKTTRFAGARVAAAGQFQNEIAPEPGGPAIGKPLPAWRARTATPEELRELREQEARIDARYAALLLRAADENTPLEDVFSEACLLDPRGRRELLPGELEAYAAFVRRAAADENALRALDDAGNPQWISLTLRERRDDGPVRAKGVLPSDEESAAPRDLLTEKKERQERESGLFHSMKRFFGSRSAGREEAESPPGRRKKTPPEPSPLGGFIKMLLVGACLALLWHFLVRGGIVSRLFSA